MNKYRNEKKCCNYLSNLFLPYVRLILSKNNATIILDYIKTAPKSDGGCYIYIYILTFF